jgi:hypothetical protein
MATEADETFFEALLWPLIVEPLIHAMKKQTLDESKQLIPHIMPKN